jgi:ATP-dependent helicase YprA (DUF1998 family)
MNETMRRVFMSNIKSYESAVKDIDKGKEVKKEMINKIRAYFYIITFMRHKYGCPYCTSIPKCGCSVITRNSYCGRDDKKLHIPDLW